MTYDIVPNDIELFEHYYDEVDEAFCNDTMNIIDLNEIYSDDCVNSDNENEDENQNHDFIIIKTQRGGNKLCHDGYMLTPPTKSKLIQHIGSAKEVIIPNQV